MAKKKKTTYGTFIEHEAAWQTGKAQAGGEILTPDISTQVSPCLPLNPLSPFSHF